MRPGASTSFGQLRIGEDRAMSIQHCVRDSGFCDGINAPQCGCNLHFKVFKSFFIFLRLVTTSFLVSFV